MYLFHTIILYDFFLLGTKIEIPSRGTISSAGTLREKN